MNSGIRFTEQVAQPLPAPDFLSVRLIYGAFSQGRCVQEMDYYLKYLAQCLLHNFYSIKLTHFIIK